MYIKRNKNKLMKTIFYTLVILFLSFSVAAQERTVKVDFESSSFENNPKIPYDQPFGIIGDVGKDISFVKVNILSQGKREVLEEYTWNRIKANTSGSFTVVIPPVLKSNTTYDFEIITYKEISKEQRLKLLNELEKKVRFFLTNNLYFDGKNVNVNKPKKVFEQLEELINESLLFFESKNLLPIQAPSSLVLEELKNLDDFKFGRFFKKTSREEKKDIANELLDKKIDQLVGLISSELTPFINSQLVQHHRMAIVSSVETDKETFSLPINFGMYAWNKTLTADNTETGNFEFTPAIGFTIPFSNKSSLKNRSRVFDSFGFSAGVLLKPVTDIAGNKFTTPGLDVPIYTGFGIRMFKIARINAGVLLLDEKGSNNFDKLTIIPTAGIAFELNLWMGIKK